MSEPEVVTDRDSFRATAAGASPGTRVPVELRIAVDDPFTAYRRARGGRGAGGAYLETTGGSEGWSYFGVDPIRQFSVGPDDGPSIEALADAVAGEELARGDCDVPYPCGAVGWISYDVARELESLPAGARRDRDLPRLQFAVFDRLAAWEEPRTEGGTTLRIVACPQVPGPSAGDGGDAVVDGQGVPDGDAEADRAGGDADDRVDAAYDRGLDRAYALARAALEGDAAVGAPDVEAADARFESASGREAYCDAVRRVKEYVRAGDTFQANISHRLVAPAAVHPVEAFAALRRVNPAPYSSLLEFPGVDLVSASPELLLHREGDRLVTEPIAGTRPRGETVEEDEALEADLLSDEKERAEHAMLVDLERNDLGKVSEYGSVEVSEYRRIDRYSEVMHLVSVVEGRLRAGCDLADAVAAVFPGGTITGAPKPRTMEIIDELETTRRGPYTGSVGIVGFDDRATLNIVIRTLVRYGDEYHLRAGAGIVHDSVPEKEYDETLDKARALVNAIDAALDRRIRFSVEGAEQ